MGSRLFVGGLSFSTDDAGLRAAFEPHGKVLEAKVITDRETGRSRGFGFVNFADESEAREAVAKMDGAFVDGRTIRVNEAQDRAGPARSGGPPRDRQGPPRGRDGPPPYGARAPEGAPRTGPGGPRYDGPPRGGRGPDGPRREPDFVQRGRPGGGPGGGPPGSAPWSPPPPVDEQFQRDFDERPRRDRSTKKPKRERDPERAAPRPARTKKRSSGQSWRDLDVEEDD